ncbi:hypothetical protein [Georgenia sp. SYP-B2076]|nr:hypothetical protein [Georgenia sp. SYP-B2076]
MTGIVTLLPAVRAARPGGITPPAADVLIRPTNVRTSFTVPASCP